MRTDGPSFAFANAPATTMVVHSPEREWNLALDRDYARFELRSGDQWVGDYGDATAIAQPSRKERSQVVAKGFPLDTNLWSAATIKASNLPQTWTVLVQIHQRPERLPGRVESVGKSPAFDLRVQRGRLIIGIRGDTEEITTVNQQQPNVVYSEPWTSDGRACDYVFRTLLHWTHGELQVWRDGVELCNAAGLCFGYNDVDPVSRPSWSIGLYRQHVPPGRPGEVAIAEYANIVPPTTASLADRVANPPRFPA